MNMIELAKKLTIDHVWKIYLEIHDPDQTKMNQKWTYHDLQSFKMGMYEVYFVEPVYTTKLKTKNYNCNENNDMKVTKCLDHYYMTKLKCTFPWLPPKVGFTFPLWEY